MISPSIIERCIISTNNEDYLTTEIAVNNKNMNQQTPSFVINKHTFCVMIHQTRMCSDWVGIKYLQQRVSDNIIFLDMSHFSQMPRSHHDEWSKLKYQIPVSTSWICYRALEIYTIKIRITLQCRAHFT